MDIVSLIVLCVALAIAFIFKINSGLVAIAFSLILALCTGIPNKFLISSFNSSLFLTLLGVMFLFSLAQENKTLELLSKKTFAACKGNTKILPIVMFFVPAIISAIGPGLISVTALISGIVISLAKEMKTPAIRLVPFGMLGAFAGGLSTITPSGIVAVNIAEANDITGVGSSMPWKMALTCLIYAVVLYFFVFKWHRVKRDTSFTEQQTVAEPIPAFSVQQIATLIGILVVAVVSAVTGINVGLVSFVVAVILVLFKVADEGAALKKTPWGTLVLITGVGILISLVTELGGIDLLSTGLRSLSTAKTAAPIMGILSGVMSWVSSASGVVMPTLIPTVPDMVQAVAGVNAVELVNCISIGANMAALSPLSTCGALMLAAYSSDESVTVKERNRMFAQLFILSACGVALTGLLALLGVY